MAQSAAARKRAQRDRERGGIGPTHDTPLTATTVDAALLHALSLLSLKPEATVADVLTLASKQFAVPGNARPWIGRLLGDRAGNFLRRHPPF